MISFGARTNEIHHDLVIIEIYPNVSAIDSMKLVLDLSDLLQEIFGGVEARTSEMDTNLPKNRASGWATGLRVACSSLITRGSWATASKK